MKKLLLILLCFPIIGYSQLKVAILDFENTSGIEKYDGLGKALSNMLITDLKNNIHPRKIVFMERSQLNKILDEQNIQKSKNFDKSTAVNFGKLAGVDFVIIGSIYVLDKHCNITSRMVNVETSEITHSKEVDGFINNWMTLKSNLAQEFANAVNNPISIENADQTTSEGVLVQYSKVIKAIDENNVEKAESMISMMKDLGVDFEYLDFLSEDVNKLKEQLKELELELEISVADPIGASNNFYESGDYINSIKYLKVGQNRLEKNDLGGIIYFNLLLHKSYAKLDINKALAYCDSILNIYPYFEVALQAKYETLYHNGQFTEALNIIKPIIIDNDNYANPYKYSDVDLFVNFIEDYKKKKGLSKKRLKGFNYSPRGHGFVVELVDNYDKQDMHPHKQHLPHDGFGTGYSQGHSFDVHLMWLIKCMKELYTFEEIIIFLENIYFNEFGYIENFERVKYPNDRRKGSYASYNTDSVGSGSWAIGCTDPLVVNYDASALVDDGSCMYPCTDNSVYVAVVTGFNGDHCSWDITDASGAVVASGGPYTIGYNTISDSACVIDGSYTLNMYDASGSGWSSYKYDTKSQFKGSVTLTDGAGGTYATGQSCGNCDKLKCNYHYLISKRIKSWDDIKNSVGSIDTSFDFTVGATLTDFDPDEIRSFQIVSSSAAAGITTHPQYTRLNSAGRHVKLYFAKNNQTYSGDYHSFLNIWDSSGQNKIQDKWTQKGPEDCPCELLLTEEDIKNNNNKKTTNYPREITSWDEFNLSNSIAWYYLKNNHPEKSINIFIKLSDYLIGDNGEVGDYYHMTKINLGHAYLLSGDLLKAQDIYKKYKLTGKFIYSWELTTGQTNDFYNKKSIKEFYLEDWTGFYNDGVLSKNNFILIKKELNIK